MQEKENQEELAHQVEEVREELREEEKKIRELEEKVSKLEHIARVANQRYVDLQREMELFKERYRRDLEEQRKYGYEKLALDLLEIVDNFERAFASASEELSTYMTGFQLIYRELKRVLEKYGIREMELEGKEFDPYLAEAIEKDYTSDVPPNTVIKVIRKGYMIHDRVLRPAKVIVSVQEEEIT
ncbi:nucleotide exchange factor GrpE [Hydrogenobacter thermophilus]|uniref:nucleotide exchange factor GrpE n=1 Tax=Hydrogenobacter thermophilus TaxID=940 RepID=UPI0030F7C414